MDVPFADVIAAAPEVDCGPVPDAIDGAARLPVAFAVGIAPPLAMLVDAAAELTGVGLGMFAMLL